MKPIASYSRLLAFLFCYWELVTIEAQHRTTTDSERCCLRLPNSTLASPSCRPTRLKATQFQRSITTPNYPGAFDEGSFCTWEIHAMPGRRILLDFRNMDLASMDANECSSQRLIIRSPLTGLSLGPYCGQYGLPNIVTAGNYIVVELQSPGPTNGRVYKGFEMVYAETVQATSIGLRPPDWSDGMYLEFKRPGPTTRPPRIKPKRKTTLATTTTHEAFHTQKPQKEHKKKPPKPRDRVLANPNSIRNIALDPYRPLPRFPTRIQEKPEEEGIGTEAIVGIVVGGIAVVAIISIATAKLGFYRASKRRKRHEDEQGELEEGPMHYFNPVQKTSQLPEVWRPQVSKKDTGYYRVNYEYNSADVPKKRIRKSSKNRSESVEKTSSSKTLRYAPASRDRSAKREQKTTRDDKRSRHRDRGKHPVKRHSEKTEERDKNSNHRKHRHDTDRAHKKRNRQQDRYGRRS